MTDDVEIQPNPEIAAVVKEARGTFDLTARLKGRALRTGSITVYTDDVTGQKHQELDLKLQRISDSAANLKKLAETARTIGLEDGAKALEALAVQALANTDLALYNQIEKERDGLLDVLNSTSITFNLRAVPEIIVKDTRRKSKLALQINGPVPEDRQEEWGDYFTAYLLTQAVVSFTDNGSGDTSGSLSIDDARALSDYLPTEQFKKLNVKLADIQYKNTISDSVIAEADF